MAEPAKTVPLSAVVAAIERELGFRASNIRSLFRRLSEVGMLPAGGPHASPMLDCREVGTLILALGADATVPDTPEAVSVLDRLMPDGIVMDDEMPESIKSKLHRAGHALDALLEAAVEDDDALRSIDFIEIVSSWPEIAIHWSDGKPERFREPGKDAGLWGAMHMRSIKIPGKALFYCIRRLFADETADAA